MTDMKPIIATGYLLAEGDAVFLCEDGSWSPDIGKSFVADTEEKATTLRRRLNEADRQAIIVDGYEIEVACENGNIRPVKMREQFRILREPTVEYLQSHQAHRAHRAHRAKAQSQAQKMVA